jgi:hypothetical protein
MAPVCYQFSIRETIKQIRSYEEFQQNDGKISDLGNFDYKGMDDSLHFILGPYLLDTLHPDKSLIHKIGSYCLDSNLLIVDYRPLDESKAGIKVLTRQVIVQGSFNHCLDLIYYLEHNEHMGRVVAAKFWSILDSKDKIMRLNCSIYIQNITNTLDETP